MSEIWTTVSTTSQVLTIEQLAELQTLVDDIGQLVDQLTTEVWVPEIQKWSAD